MDKKTKVYAGETFKNALLVLFLLVVIGLIVTMLKLFDADAMTFEKFLIGLFICFLSFIPVMFADVLLHIEINTDPDNYKQNTSKAENAPIARQEARIPVVPPVVASTPPTPIDTGKVATVSGDTVICPNCGKAQKSNRSICFDCGTALKTE